MRMCRTEEAEQIKTNDMVIVEDSSIVLWQIL
jgi:hypothetical protein